MLSVATALLAQLELPPGASLVDLGIHEMQGLRNPEHLYQLTVDGLPADFPPLRTHTLFNSNLPRRATSFVGRLGSRRSCSRPSGGIGW